MFKVMIVLTRRADLSHDEFAQWWLGEHRALAAELPGIRRLCFNVIEGDADADGIAEQWFDSQDDFTAAYASEQGQHVVADSLAHVADRRRFFVTENWVVGES